jgi:hypothetical protein
MYQYKKIMIIKLIILRYTYEIEWLKKKNLKRLKWKKKTKIYSLYIVLSWNTSIFLKYFKKFFSYQDDELKFFFPFNTSLRSFISFSSSSGSSKALLIVSLKT